MAEIDDWIKAGKIAAEALEYGRKLIKPGKSMLELCDDVDKKIKQLGGQPAFPSQVSCDHVAAHFCPAPEDKTVFDKQVVSLDVGVHVNGAIGDNATTVDLSGNHTDLVKASRRTSGNGPTR